MGVHSSEQKNGPGGKTGTDLAEKDEKESGQPVTEKAEPNDKAKEKAADMMTAYEDRPTLIMPGSGGAISGTAVNDWIDDDGNPKYAADKGSPANKAKAEQGGDAKDETAEDQSSEDTEGRASIVETSRGKDGKTRGQSAEEREKKDDERSFDEKVKDDKAFNKKVIEEAAERRQGKKAASK